VVSRLSRALEGVSFGVAHGQMDEKELNDVMTRMSEGEIQVMVCTTIIETGIDIPNVNTLIIEDAYRLGLAQLHQIRGRVGRSSATLTHILPSEEIGPVRDSLQAAVRDKGICRIRLGL
jgi:transcription-repair coupling factor (superfamily II helicase)